jgi:predicted secreted hydrolase
VEPQNSLTNIFLGKWSANIGPEHRLSAKAPSFSFDLVNKPLKAPVLHGRQGYSLKGKRPESASCYYSFTRLESSGTLSVDGRTEPVKGTAWMDHEFSSAPLEEDLVGWDWFSIQLDDQTELMIYLLRHPDGTYSNASSGTFVSPSRESIHLTHETRVRSPDRWTSQRSGAHLPVAIARAPSGTRADDRSQAADQNRDHAIHASDLLGRKRFCFRKNKGKMVEE